MRDIELYRRLKSIGKPFYNIYDLQKITGLKDDTLYVSLNRWVKEGILTRIARGIYILSDAPFNLESLASQFYMPNYLSFESALAKYGALNLIPYALTYATTRKTKKLTMLNRLVEFRQIKKELFFGFEIMDGIYIATPEKAFIDTIYFWSRGKITLNRDELNLKNLSQRMLSKMTQKYPVYVRRKLSEVLE